MGVAYQAVTNHHRKARNVSVRRQAEILAALIVLAVLAAAIYSAYEILATNAAPQSTQKPTCVVIERTLSAFHERPYHVWNLDPNPAPRPI
jgi:hypothetical protein